MNTVKLSDKDLALVLHVLIDYRDTMMERHGETMLHLVSSPELDAISRSQQIIDQLGEL